MTSDFLRNPLCENQIRTVRRFAIEMEPRKIRVIGNGKENGVFDDFRVAKTPKKLSKWNHSVAT